MAAQVVAAELELDLFRVDLASAVSKFIGETAKNLRRIFRRAECMNAVLLFDEADALLSKRTDSRTLMIATPTPTPTIFFSCWKGSSASPCWPATRRETSTPPSPAGYATCSIFRGQSHPSGYRSGAE